MPLNVLDGDAKCRVMTVVDEANSLGHIEKARLPPVCQGGTGEVEGLFRAGLMHRRLIAEV